MVEYPENLKKAERLARIFPNFTFDKKLVLSNSWSIKLIHKQIPNAAMHVRVDSQKWEFSGCWFRDAEGGWYEPKENITVKVDSSRTDEAIRRDVERRLLKWYYEELENQRKRFEQACENIQSRKAALKELAELVNYGKLKDEQSAWIHPHSYGIKSIGVNHDGSTVFIKLDYASIPFEEAKKMIAFLKELQPEND